MGNSCCVRSIDNAGIEAVQRHSSDYQTDRFSYSSSITFDAKPDPNYSSSEMSMDCFNLIKVIGRGSFGKVYLVRKKDDGKVYAVKTLKKDMIIRKNQMENTKGKNGG